MEKKDRMKNLWKKERCDRSKHFHCGVPSFLDDDGDDEEFLKQSKKKKEVLRLLLRLLKKEYFEFPSRLSFLARKKKWLRSMLNWASPANLKSWTCSIWKVGIEKIWEEKKKKSQEVLLDRYTLEKEKVSCSRVSSR